MGHELEPLDSSRWLTYTADASKGPTRHRTSASSSAVLRCLANADSAESRAGPASYEDGQSCDSGPWISVAFRPFDGAQTTPSLACCLTPLHSVEAEQRGAPTGGGQFPRLPSQIDIAADYLDPEGSQASSREVIAASIICTDDLSFCSFKGAAGIDGDGGLGAPEAGPTPVNLEVKPRQTSLDPRCLQCHIFWGLFHARVSDFLLTSPPFFCPPPQPSVRPPPSLSSSLDTLLSILLHPLLSPLAAARKGRETSIAEDACKVSAT